MKKLFFEVAGVGANMAVADCGGAMVEDSILKHGASSKSLMSRANFLIAICLAIFCGCDKDKDNDKDSEKDKPFRYDMVNIGNAQYIISMEQPQTQTRSSTKNSFSGYYDFHKITEDGKIEPISFIDEHGDTITREISISNIVDINSDFLLFQGYFPYVDEDGNFRRYENLLANKKTEKIFAFPENIRFGGLAFFTDANGDIYSAENSIYKINTVDNMVTTFSFGENETFYPYWGFLIDRHGIILYMSGNSFGISLRARHTSNWNRIVPIDEINSFFILGNNGYIYFLNVDEFIDFNAGGRQITLYRIDEDGTDIKTTVLSNHIVGNHWVNGLEFNHVNDDLMVFSGNHNLNENSLHLFNIADNSWQTISLPVGALSGQQYISQNSFYYYDDSSRKFSRLDLNTYEVSEISVSGYDIYSVTTSMHSDEINFTGMRFSDSRNIAGRIDASGNVTIITEGAGTNNIRIESLIPLN